MDELTQQQIQTITRTLPTDINGLLADEKTLDQISAIGSKYGLTKVENGLLAQVTSSLMIGILKPHEFIATIMDYCSVPREKAALIAQDINREIFSGVKESLKKVHSAGSVIPSPIPSNAVIVDSTPADPPKSAFEQKLAPAFQMSTPALPTEPVRPKFVMPIFAHPVQPPTPAPITPSQKPAVDPYHELPV